MARLPQPGGDDGSWGDILNTFLTTIHNTDGTLKSGSVTSGTLDVGAVTTANLQSGSVTATKLSAPSPSDGQVLGYTGGALSWTSPAGTPVATGSATGTITLAGDLSGTATAPTVPGLATKATDSTVVHLAGTETISGAKNFTGGLQTAGQNVVATNDARLSDQRTPVDLSVTPLKLSAGAGVDGQVLSYSGGNLLWSTASSTTVSDAGAGVKGILALSGDLSGTAAAPTVPGLATKATDSAVVHLAGAETVSGVKTFNASPVVPTPTTGTQAATKAYVDTAVGAGGAPATTSALGTVQLAGDLAGTATAPTVPGLATKATDSLVVHLAGTETITGNKTFSGTVQVGAQVVVVANDARLSDQRTPLDASVTPTKLNAVAAPTSGQVLGYNGTKFNWVAPAAGGSNGYSFTILHKSADYTANAFDMVFIDTTPAMVTITLPTPAVNATVRVKRLAPNGNSVQVVAPVSSYIDASAGVGSDTLNTQFMSQDYWSDGSNWFRV